ncbi:MobQ family relaxase [Eubacterium sp.]|uniref:MobQ family relaxase n=1 Tax=Eubacterium sp. TaxID=142586 RepID=UPI0039A1CC7F
MAIFHLSVKMISRGKGKSAVAASAYRSGEKITSDYDGITHDYTRKRGIAKTLIMLPDNAPLEFYNRSTLWNAVEKIEKAKNSQLAREVEVAIPNELSISDQYSLVKEFCNMNFVDKGMIADICFHNKKDGNPHAHIMLTVRPFNEDGSWGSKQKKVYILDGNGEKIYDKKKRQYKCKSVSSTDWNERSNVEKWRKSWADMCNTYLEKSGHDERIDHRSYERQGLEILPTEHLGTAASQMEKRNIKTKRGDVNRHVRLINKMIQFYNDEIARLKEEAKQLIKDVKEKVAGIAKRLEDFRKNYIFATYAEINNEQKLSEYRKLVPKGMDVIKKAYDLIRKRNRMDEEKRAYADVMNSKKEKKARRKQAEEMFNQLVGELNKVDGKLNELPQMYRLFSLDEMEDAIKNEEKYGRAIARLEKMADRIETAKEIALLEYQVEKENIEPEDTQAVEEERAKIRPDMEQQAKGELVGMYGRDFDGETFEHAVMKADVELGDGATEEKDYIKYKEKLRR